MIAQTHSMVLHIVITILSSYLFILFAIWWKIEKHATTLYKITCFLMLGISQTHLGAVLMYFDYWDDGKIDVINLWLWPFRHYLMVVALLIYAFHITGKFISSTRAKNLHLNNHRRKDD